MESAYIYSARGGSIVGTAVATRPATLAKLDVDGKPFPIKPFAYKALSESGSRVMLDRYPVTGEQVAAFVQLCIGINDGEERRAFLAATVADGEVVRSQKSPLTPTESQAVIVADAFFDADLGVADLAAMFADGFFIWPTATSATGPVKAKKVKLSTAAAITASAGDMFARAKAARVARALMVARFDVDTATLALTAAQDALTHAQATGDDELAAPAAALAASAHDALTAAQATLAALLPVEPAPAIVEPAPAKAVELAPVGPAHVAQAIGASVKASAHK